VYQAQLTRGGRHPLYDQILEIPQQIVPSQDSSAGGAEGTSEGSTPCNPAPLDAITDNTSAGPGDEDWCIRRCTELALERGIGRKEAPDQGMAFFRCVNQCMGSNDYPERRPYFPPAQHSESQSLLSSILPHLQTISPWWVVIPFLPFVLAAP
jgi:hypothetical protein